MVLLPHDSLATARLRSVGASSITGVLPSITRLCYLRFQLFDPRQRQIRKLLTNNTRRKTCSGGAVSTSGFCPRGGEHSSHLSARISGLVRSRANLLQRSVTLDPPVVLSACPWTSAGIGCILGQLISLTLVENMSMNRKQHLFFPDRKLGGLLPFAVYTFECPLGTDEI